jgi:predicted DNA-binding transcriptional regulator AlpA
MSKRIHRTPAAAERLGHASSTLEKWRVTGQGPRYIKIGRSVGYTDEDLDEFIELRRRASTSDVKPTPIAAAPVPEREHPPQRVSAAPAATAQPERPAGAKPRPRSGPRQRARVASAASTNTAGESLK